MIKSQRILVSGCVLVVFALMISQRNVKPEFIFPKCNISNPIQSELTFFIDDSLFIKVKLSESCMKLWRCLTQY